VVLVADFQFTPARLVIHRGDTVTWRNTGGFHNVVADDGSFHCAEGCDDTGGNGDPSAALWTFTRSFTAAGDAPYHCVVHGGAGGRGMSGVIVVEP
jgi:plastocyanin